MAPISLAGRKPMTTSHYDVDRLLQRPDALEGRLAAAELTAARAADRGAVENVFNRYMHYHNAYEDERIIDEHWGQAGHRGCPRPLQQRR